MNEESVAPAYTDFRSPFEQDYGRAVFSTPVRRLQHKAQVFPLEPIDAVRTRLTHSMEVSSVARSITRNTMRSVKDAVLDEDSRYIIETIAATCALLHDSGNPPFGHFGETAIRSWFKDKSELLGKMPSEYAGDLEAYEGNAHTIRLVTRLQVLSDFRGLNLTAGTMSALLKYTASSTEIDSSKTAPQSRKKLGYFQSERQEIERIKTETGTGNARNPITFLVEASDDLTYLCVDLEDAVKKGIFRWSEIEEELEDKAPALFKNVVDFARKCGALHTGSALSEAKAQYFRTIAIRFGAEAVTRCFLENYLKIMSGEWDRELLYESDAKDFFTALKMFSIKHIYSAKQTVRLEILGHNVMHDLLDLFAKAEKDPKRSTFQRKVYDLMSKNYRAVYEDGLSKLPSAYCKALLLADYICGMTDNFAVRLHGDLMEGRL